MRMARMLMLFLVVLAGEATSAQAAAPTLSAVGHDQRHPTAVFAAAGADSVTIYVATQPDRATDGSFLSENIADTDWLTDEEIASGSWMDDDRVEPGPYFVMAHAISYDCPEGMDCADGFSNVMTFTIPAITLDRETARSLIDDVMSNGRFGREWEAVSYSAYDPDPIRKCSRLSRLRIRCRLSWAAGDLGFTGSATVIRRLRHDDHVRWSLKSTDYYCASTGGTHCTRKYHGG